MKIYRRCFSIKFYLKKKFNNNTRKKRWKSKFRNKNRDGTAKFRKIKTAFINYVTNEDL